MIHGRTVQAREGVTCPRAKVILAEYLSTLESAPGWECHGYKRQTWRGYCETASGRRYFAWRQL